MKLVTGKYAEGNIFGPASSLSDKSLICPCAHFKCRLKCPCNPCRVNSSVCKNPDHEISPGGGCSECQDDYWEHILFHLVEHTKCKFCREVESFLRHKKCVVYKTRGYYPNFHQVAIESFLVVHIPAYLRPDKADSTNGFQCDKCEKPSHLKVIFDDMKRSKISEKRTHVSCVEDSFCGIIDWMCT